MRKTSKRLLISGLILLLLATIPGLAWVSLTHKPGFYRAMVRLPRGEREVKARRFMAQSLQLRNDICNEPTWEALFTDQEVNAWLAEDLVTHFADQVPPEVHEPRVVFELDRVTLAFQLDQGPLSSVIWVVARPHVPEGNVIELTLEKIRAGVLPVPADQILDRITAYAREHGLDVQWRRGDEGFPIVTLRYTPDSQRDDVKLVRVQIQHGQIRLAGQSNHLRGVVRSPTLPTRKVLQSKFPRRKVQARTATGPRSESHAPSLRSSAKPTSRAPDSTTWTQSGVQIRGS
jgi:hypothetical protein